MNPQPNRSSVQFNKPVVLPGALAGVAIALGVPAITMVYGRYLPVNLQMAIMIIGLLLGGGTALVSAFFGAVMPSSVTDGEWTGAAAGEPPPGRADQTVPTAAPDAGALPTVWSEPALPVRSNSSASS